MTAPPFGREGRPGGRLARGQGVPGYTARLAHLDELGDHRGSRRAGNLASQAGSCVNHVVPRVRDAMIARMHHVFGDRRWISTHRGDA
ncbi:MAG TPA: hypothetical protein VN213_02545 [Solirubrobacteraceae bacterium]|nr:hypothetical protein [Solirubrobacteraceae bacterium]